MIRKDGAERARINEERRLQLRQLVNQYDNAKIYAKKVGIDVANICNMLNGNAKVSDTALGLVRQIKPKKTSVATIKKRVLEPWEQWAFKNKTQSWNYLLGLKCKVRKNELKLKSEFDLYNLKGGK